MEGEGERKREEYTTDFPDLEADRVHHCGLNDLSPWKHSPSHGDGLKRVAVGHVFCALPEKEEWKTFTL